MTQRNALLVYRAVAGDERAWSELFTQYSGLLRAIARQFRLGDEQAADAAQTTWMRLVENIKRVRDPERLAGWLATTMRRECIRVANQRRDEILTDDCADTRFGHSEAADVDMLLAERNALIWSAVERLPERQRRVVHALADEPPPSYDEVAAALSIPVGAIGPTRQRALRKLRLLLAEMGVVEFVTVLSVVDGEASREPRTSRKRGDGAPSLTVVCGEEGRRRGGRTSS
jgi:RNA polymerase sigma factor (sigma-70 family)